MKIKRIDQLLNVSLWVIFLLCVALSWVVADKISAPDYELAESEYAEPYTYETDEGERVTSTYYLAWYHKKSYVNPDLVVYDPSNGRAEFFKPEYLEKYKAMAAESNYKGLWHHLFWVWFIVLSLGFGIVICLYGPDLRDKILARILRGRRDQFLELSYFMFDTDRCASARQQVRAMIPSAAKQYILKNHYYLSRKFSEKFYEVLVGWFNVIARTGSTTIPYTYQFENHLTQMQSYIEFLIKYWDTKRGIDPKADDNINYLRKLQEKKYVTIPTITEDRSYETSVTNQLNKMFADIMESEVFTFKAQSGYASALHGVGRREKVVVKTALYNDVSKSFTWSGSSCSGMVFPGIRVFFTVDIVRGDDVTNLWRGDLEPVCNYTSKDEDFSESDLYSNMIVHTIDTFVSTMKKAK